MKRLLFAFILLWSMGFAFADVLTDKTMSKISRDTKTYISADCRATTEQEAYDNAMKELSAQIADYMKSQYGESPDAVYLSDVSSIYQRLSSYLDGSRYRVLLYVKKSDLKPMGNNDNAVVLAKNEQDSYEPIPPVKSEPIVVTDTVTVVNVVEVPLNPTVSRIMSCDTDDSLAKVLTQLCKEGEISQAAAYPLANDYYLAIVSPSNNIIAYIHIVDGKWTDLTTGKKVSPYAYSIGFTAYWFTLPKKIKSYENE